MQPSRPSPPFPSRHLALAFAAIALLALLAALPVPGFAAGKPAPGRYQPPATEPVAPQLDPGREQLVLELRAAKAAGDRTTARELALRLGWSGDPDLAAARGLSSRATPPASAEADQIGTAPGQKWGGDVLVVPSGRHPALACTAAGILYLAAVRGSDLFLMKSLDGGLTWDIDMFEDDDVTLAEPCLAIVEAPSPRLLLAYVRGAGTSICEVRVLVKNLATGALTGSTAFSAPYLGLASLRLCVDAPEYQVWYPYLVCNVQSVDSHLVWFTRSLDEGATWQAALTLAAGLTAEDQVDIDFGATTLAVVHTRTAVDSDLYLLRSPDFGATWGAGLQVTGTGFDEFDPRLAISTAGDLRLTFTRNRPGSLDVESLWTADGGATWWLSYLPYDDREERYAAVMAVPWTRRFQAAYWRSGEIHFASLDLDAGDSWSEAVPVGDAAHAVQLWPCIAACPFPGEEAAVAWRADDSWQPGIYFDLAASARAPRVDYLVLCPDEMAFAAGKLAGWRRARGLRSAVVTLSQVGVDPLTPFDLDAWLEAYWTEHPELRYLALVGDVSLLPSYALVNPDTEEPFHSDLRYACREAGWPASYLPELAVGRLPVSSAAELEMVIDKIQRFEASYGTRDRIVFFGNLPEMNYVATRDSAYAVAMGYGVTTLYSPDESQLMMALGAPDVAAAFYYGHGSYAANWPLHTGNLGLLTNAERPLLYFSGGCSINDSQAPVRPLGYELVVRPEGAAASTGCAVAGGYGYGYEMARSLIGTLATWPRLGDAFRLALEYHYYEASSHVSVGPDSWVYWFTERMTLIGDPGMIISGTLTGTPASPPPQRLRLAQNRPNPFNAGTTIAFELPVAGRIRLTVHDALGRRLTVLASGACAAGTHGVRWDGRDDAGRGCASGIYFYRLETAAGTETRRMTLVK